MTLRRLGPEKGEQAVEVREGAVVRDALRAAGIVPETVLVARGRDVIPDDEPVREGEELLVTRVVTGGAAEDPGARTANPARRRSPSRRFG